MTKAELFKKGTEYVFDTIRGKLDDEVKYTVEDQTGLEVESVNIFVDGVRVDN